MPQKVGFSEAWAPPPASAGRRAPSSVSMLVRRRFGQREDGREFMEVHRGLRGGGVFLPSEALPYDNGQQKPGGRPGWDVSVVGGIGLWHPNQREARQGDVRRVFGEPSHPAVQAGHVVTAYPDQHRIRLGLNSNCSPFEGSVTVTIERVSSISTAWAERGQVQGLVNTRFEYPSTSTRGHLWVKASGSRLGHPRPLTFLQMVGSRTQGPWCRR
jgi:hypothetical protein